MCSVSGNPSLGLFEKCQLFPFTFGDIFELYSCYVPPQDKWWFVWIFGKNSGYLFFAFQNCNRNIQILYLPTCATSWQTISSKILRSFVSASYHEEKKNQLTSSYKSDLNDFKFITYTLDKFDHYTKEKNQGIDDVIKKLNIF